MLKKIVIHMLCLGVFSGSAWAQSTAGAPDEVLETPAELPAQIHVTAQRPGPGLWKVTHGEHVLWVFGTYAPLPKKMEWRSHKVEKAIAGSQEYIGPPSGEFKVGLFQTVTALPSLIGVKNNPDGGTLRDLLTEQEYAEWQALKQRYGMTSDSVERLRPLFAGQELMQAAREQAGLASDQSVRKQLLALVKQYKLKQTSSKISVPVENARAAVKNVKRNALGDNVCLVTTMHSLERDIAEARARAEAWAQGDIGQLRSLNLGADAHACFDSMANSAGLDAVPGMRTAKQDSHTLWLTNAERALTTNRASFALLNMADILAPRGLLAQLAAKGYTVQAPE